MAQGQFRKELLLPRIGRPVLPVRQYPGARRYFLGDLLVEAREQFADRLAVHRLIRQGGFQGRQTRGILVAGHLAALVRHFRAQQESHFLP